jgi:hypothetical protein
MSNPLPMFVVLSLLVGALSAQEYFDSLTKGGLTQSDFRTLLSQAESGDGEAQYRLANGERPSSLRFPAENGELLWDLHTAS